VDCLSFLKYEVSTPRNSGWRPGEVEIAPILQDNSHKKRISNRISPFFRKALGTCPDWPLRRKWETHKTKFHRDTFAAVEEHDQPSRPNLVFLNRPTLTASIPPICLTNPSGTRGPEPTARAPVPGTFLLCTCTCSRDVEKRRGAGQCGR
jgi:hypothetical protein